MRVIDGLLARARDVRRAIGGGVVDSGHASLLGLDLRGSTCDGDGFAQIADLQNDVDASGFEGSQRDVIPAGGTEAGVLGRHAIGSRSEIEGAIESVSA